MRQAGRYLPEYRALRQKHSPLELCHKPELAAQVTLQPIERLGVDAAILFADILLPFEPLGLGLTFSAGEGPQITRPVREAGQVLELPPVDPATDLAYVLEAARIAARALPHHIPLIGLAGAPVTLASYAIEGVAASRSRRHSGKPRSRGAARPPGGARAPDAGDPGPRGLAARTHLQPGSRRASRNADRGAASRGGVGAWRLTRARSPSSSWRTAARTAWTTSSPICSTCAVVVR